MLDMGFEPQIRRIVQEADMPPKARPPLAITTVMSDQARPRLGADRPAHRLQES